MMQIDFAYGERSLPLSYDEARFQVLGSVRSESEPLSDAEIGQAFDRPIASPSLEDLFEVGDSVLIVVSDATRATASGQIVNLLVRRLIQNGISPQDVAIIFATGIHRAVTPEEKRQLITPFIYQRIRTIDHDANDPASMTLLGTTERGTPIELNRALIEFKHVIIVSGISFHYFAGFTGGRKSICPGLASAQTIRATHMLALDFETGGRRKGVGTGLLQGNTVHEECETIAERVKPAFAINTVVDEFGRAVKVYVGDWREAHRRGCEEYFQDHSVPISSKRQVVIVSCGGSPYDINLIQAHKALDTAARACAEGGTIVLIAECSDGLGRPDFLKWFDGKGSRHLASRLREAYEVNGQTAWALLTKTELFRVILVSALAPQDASRMGMDPAQSLDLALAEVSPGATGYLLPRGASLLPRYEN